MRKIILVSLFFCLTITTVLAQVATINIVTPSSNGLSNNQVDDFDVNSDGTILNNSSIQLEAQPRFRKYLVLSGTPMELLGNCNMHGCGFINPR